MKKILLSVLTIVAVGGAVAGITAAYYNDTETSSGNIFTAGTVDLKVDHTVQNYNGVDCKTCSRTIQSDTTNVVIAQVGGIDQGPFPHSAVLVSHINPAWTASIPGASWIWWTDPTPASELGVDTTYTFQKTFDWMGPIDGAILNLYVGADNSYQVSLNGHPVGGDSAEWNFTTATQDTYSGTQVSQYIQQGQNVLEIKVKNMLRPAGQTWDNPGGLLYKFTIDGKCGDDYFKNQCRLWGDKDLGEGDIFWNLNDIKPADQGTDVISLHAVGNDAWACGFINGTDLENTLVEPEVSLNDDTSVGELSSNMKLFAWKDDGDGVYEPTGETAVYEGVFGPNTILPFAQNGGTPITGNTTAYLGMKWCAGTQSVNHTSGVITCDGSGLTDIAQTDSFPATVTLYTEQWRSNPNFSCSTVQLPD